MASRSRPTARRRSAAASPWFRWGRCQDRRGGRRGFRFARARLIRHRAMRVAIRDLAPRSAAWRSSKMESVRSVRRAASCYTHAEAAADAEPLAVIQPERGEASSATAGAMSVGQCRGGAPDEPHQLLAFSSPRPCHARSRPTRANPCWRSCRSARTRAPATSSARPRPPEPPRRWRAGFHPRARVPITEMMRPFLPPSGVGLPHGSNGSRATRQKCRSAFSNRRAWCR